MIIAFRSRCDLAVCNCTPTSGSIFSSPHLTFMDAKRVIFHTIRGQKGHTSSDYDKVPLMHAYKIVVSTTLFFLLTSLIIRHGAPSIFKPRPN